MPKSGWILARVFSVIFSASWVATKGCNTFSSYLILQALPQLDVRPAAHHCIRKPLTPLGRLQV